MRKTLAGLSALAVCASFLMPAQGADDVIQPACFGWFRKDPPPQPQPRVAGFYAVPPAQPCCPQPQPTCCPQPTCTTKYVQQTYYQPVTTFQTQTRYEPVTTYQTSYYYEAVVTYRTSRYYCPNTCMWKETQTPETSYQLKSKCCPVQSYVAKCVQVPVTSYQQGVYYQAQTECCQPPPPCCPTAVAQAPCCQPGSGAPPQASQALSPPQATATPEEGWKPPILSERDSNFKSQPKDNAAKKNGSASSWQPAPQFPAVTLSAPVETLVQTSGIKLDRIVFGGDALVEGDLVRGDKVPRPGAKILFVNANTPSLRETVTTNHAGRFQVTLASGGWLIYLYNVDGESLFHSRIEVSDEQNMGRIALVQR